MSEDTIEPNRLRWAAVITLVFVLAYLYLQVDHARIKGTELPPWKLIPLTLGAASAAFIGRRMKRPAIGILLGGLGGAFGSLDRLASPYASVVGLVVGSLVILLLPSHEIHEPQASEATAPTEEQAET